MWGPIAGLSLDPGEGADLGPCPDCGSSARSVWGYVAKNGKAHAAYYACWTENHLERGVQILVSIGRFGEGTVSTMRNMIAAECRMNGERPSFMIVDADKVVLEDQELFGKGLSRDEVLKSPLKDQAFAVLDHLCFCDERVKAFLSSKSPASQA